MCTDGDWRCIIDIDVDAVGELRRLATQWQIEPHQVGAMYERLETEHPDLIDAVMVAARRDITCSLINQALATYRQQTIRRARFQEHVEAREAGDSLFNMSYCVNDQYERKPLGLLTRRDLEYVADRYEQRARYARLSAALFRQMARKVRSGTVADHYTEEQLRGLFAKLEGEPSDG